MTDKTWTITRLLDTTQKFLADKGSDSPRLDAEILLSHVLQMPRLNLYLNFDRPLMDTELDSYRKLIKRRVAHEPVAYITGQKEFYSRVFSVTREVLIPRPETEILVDTVLKHLNTSPSPLGGEGRGEGGHGADLHGLEVGPGSGCIAVTLLCEQVNLKMTAVEISPKAAEIAKANAQKYQVEDRLQIVVTDFLNDDWKSKLADPENKFDFLVSNPPYATTDEIKTLMPDVKDHEPHLALDGGKDGLTFYRLIAARALELVKKNGFVAVEIGETQGQDVTEIFTAQGLDKTSVIHDYARLDRVVLGIS